MGADGVEGCVLIITFAETGEVHPAEFVTVKVYVPEESPDIVELVLVPFEVAPPGDTVNVHVPVEGNPFITTLPVAIVHVGEVMVPTMGAVGVEG